MSFSYLLESHHRQYGSKMGTTRPTMGRTWVRPNTGHGSYLSKKFRPKPPSWSNAIPVRSASSCRLIASFWMKQLIGKISQSRCA